MSKWQQVKLNDIVYIKTGKLDSNAAEANGIYPFFTCDPQTLRINSWAYDQEAVLLAGNNASGNYTAKYYNGKFNAYQRTYIICSKNENNLSTRFFAYALNLNLQYLKTISSGATTKFLTLSMLNNLSIPLPPIEVQRKIADVLSAYDDLIENNRKQIKLLEEAAQRLYKEWFIDLRFSGHENTPITDGIPEGWERKKLCDIIEYEIGGGWGSDSPTNTEDEAGYVIRGTDINGITNGDISTIPFRYHVKSNLSSRMLIHGDIIFEVSGGSRTEGVGKTLLVTDQLLSRFYAPVICASFCKLIRLNNSDLSYYLAVSLKHWREIGRIGEFEKKSASSIINYRWKDFLNQQKVLIPSEKIIEKYNDIEMSIYNKIITFSIMIEEARLTRDRLLPKLITGELEVK